MVEATREELNTAPAMIQSPPHGEPIGTDGPAGEKRQARISDDFAAAPSKGLRGAIEATTAHDRGQRNLGIVSPRPPP